MRSSLLVMSLVPCLALAQTTIGPALVGVTTPVNNSEGDQRDPHVSETTVAYTNQTGGSEIRYFQLSTNTDAAIPSSGAFDYLSDVSGDIIVFTRVTSGKSAIYAFDHSSPVAVPVELSAQAGSDRRSAAIGGLTVAWQDFGYSPGLFETEIVVHELSTSQTTRLTNDTLYDLDPAVSADGNVVTWTKCQSSSGGCDIWVAVKTATGWESHPLTGAEGQESLPDSNGSVVVYDSVRGVTNERDIYWQPVAGGTEQHLVLPGEQANPNISGNLIAFETRASDTDDWEIALYDLSTSTYYVLTDTPLDETLSDISFGTDGKVRVVWSVIEADANVYAFTFEIAKPNPEPCEEPPPGQRCATAAGRLPVLLDLAVDDRDFERSFSAVAGSGLVCIDNDNATSGKVSLNGEEIIGSSAFKHVVTSIERAVTLEAQNTLEARLRGSKVTSYRLRVYGAAPSCRAGTGVSTGGDPGESATVTDGMEHHVSGVSSGTAPRAGCSATGGAHGAMFALLFAALLAASLWRKPVAVRVRRSSRRSPKS